MTITYTFENRYGDDIEFEYEDASVVDYYCEMGFKLDDILSDYEEADAEIPEREEGETDEEYLEDLYEDMRWNDALEDFLEDAMREHYQDAAYDAFVDSGGYDERPYPYCYY